MRAGKGLWLRRQEKAALVAMLLLGCAQLHAQPAQDPPPASPLGLPAQPVLGALAGPTDNKVPAPAGYAGGSTAARMLAVPVSRLSPGNVPVNPGVKNPLAGNAEAIQRGMSYFISFNCVGCHAPNGGGGMGPSLSNKTFVYGAEPANIYLSIYQGRPNGMPTWGAMLPDNIIWDLVAYITSISSEPSSGWGKTISAATMSIEQVPTEYTQSVSPWAHTESFGHGQKPNRAR